MPRTAPDLYLAQPLLFLHSFSELTELPFAALIGLSFLAYQRRQFLLMAVLVAISPLSRPEGFGFLLLAAAARSRPPSMVVDCNPSGAASAVGLHRLGVVWSSAVR